MSNGASRDKYWDERDVDGKLEALRVTLLQLAAYVKKHDAELYPLGLGVSIGQRLVLTPKEEKP
jgi:hypothetical protein